MLGNSRQLILSLGKILELGCIRQQGRRRARSRRHIEQVAMCNFQSRLPAPSPSGHGTDARRHLLFAQIKAAGDAWAAWRVPDNPVLVAQVERNVIAPLCIAPQRTGKGGADSTALRIEARQRNKIGCGAVYVE